MTHFPIHITNHHLTVSDALLRFTREKVSSVCRFANDALAADVVLRRHAGAKERFSASARLALPGRDIHGRAVAGNLYAAIGKLVAKLARLSRKRKTRLAKTFEHPRRSENNIIVTAADHAELSSVISATGKISERAKWELRLLENELKRAQIVPPEEVPSDVITMNTRAEFLDLESGERMEFTLVLPADANINDGKVSVLAPLGTAMLGYRVGDTFKWPIPYGVRHLKVIKVHFQPEGSLQRAA